jgi:hypothetical protein
MSIALLIPTRERDAKARVCYERAKSLAVRDSTEIIFVVDPDDPTEYEGLPTLRIDSGGGGMGAPLNAAAALYCRTHDIVGFIGDDHLVRSHAWDETVEQHLRSPGMLYGNDLARQDIPTQIFMSSLIVEALGWMALPGSHHLYLDDAWAHLGQATGLLKYDPDLIIEHVHFAYGKAAKDDVYERVNSQSMYEHDYAVFEAWRREGFAQDIIKVKEAVRAAQA